MAAASGRDSAAVGKSSIEARLREEPFRFDFFQAVRLLERILPDRKPVGRFVRATDEVVRFAVTPSLLFPASAIQSLTWREDHMPLLGVNFMGMVGPQGVLPQWYTVFVNETTRTGGSALADFLNLFNHRVVSLFYRAWEKYRFAIAYERGEPDRFSRYLLDLLGLGTPGLQDRQAVPDDVLLFYAGLLGQKPRSAKALELLLSDYFDVPVEVEQFVGAWYRLDPPSQCCLNEQPTESVQLGSGAVVGDEIWSHQSRVRIKLGPLSLSQYLDFLPTGSAYEPFRALTRFFSNDEFEFDLQLILKRDEVPECLPGRDDEAAPRLGWVSWLKSVSMSRDPEDTVLRL